jgi:hypothetical protein
MTTNQTDEIDRLEQRLTNLAVESPDPGGVTARALSLSARPRRLHVPRAISTGVALLALVAGVAYFVPAADLAVADVPLAGDLLQDAGLIGARDRITYVGAESKSSGYKLTLVAVYADSTRTVLLLHSDPPIDLGFPTSLQLSDQFGRTYNWQGGTANTLSGDSSLQFDPLGWPDSLTGARLTLHFSSVATVEETGIGTAVPGSWTLTATIRIDQAVSLQLPAPADLGPAHFRFTSVSYTPATIAVEMDVSGVSPGDLNRMVPGYGGKAGPALMTDVIDPNGEVIDGESTDAPSGGAYHVEFFGFRQSGAGKYIVRVSYYGEGQFERVLTIP